MRFAQGKLREGSGSTDAKILRCAQDDSQDTAPVGSQEAFSSHILSRATLRCVMAGIPEAARAP